MPRLFGHVMENKLKKQFPVFGYIMENNLLMFYFFSSLLK
jgi:hypothetical protein